MCCYEFCGGILLSNLSTTDRKVNTCGLLFGRRKNVHKISLNFSFFLPGKYFILLSFKKVNKAFYNENLWYNNYYNSVDIACMD